MSFKPTYEELTSRVKELELTLQGGEREASPVVVPQAVSAMGLPNLVGMLQSERYLGAVKDAMITGLIVI